ncbi:hypothetical protein [Alkalimarinus coralli]|uniref:hypothetical protein n=1 Tax=Alkalimarinus coralli TaxID=2935863 RepID=UPI00202B58F7|nr:hypothetical protein [Alkalimarinus coralli]
MKYNMFHNFYFCMLFSSLSIASPTINKVTLSSEGGDTFIEVRGSGFGNGPNVILFDTFSNGKVGDKVPFTSPEIGTWDSYGYYGGIPKYAAITGSNHGFLMNDFESGRRKIAQLEAIFGDNTEIFVSYDVFLPDGRTFPGASTENTFPSVSSWKFAWLIDGDGISNDGIYDMVVPTHVGGGGFLVGGNEFTIGWIGSSWFSHDTVNRISFWKKANKSDPANKSGEYFFRGMSEEKKPYRTYKDDKPIFQPGLASNSFDRIRFHGWSGNGDHSNSNAIYDNIYIAVGENSQARIELGKSDRYQDNNMLTIYPPVVWEDGYVKAKLYSQNDTLNQFLFITDSTGVTVPVGVKLCSKCPEAPTLGIE